MMIGGIRTKNDIRKKLSKLRYQGAITSEEYKEILSKMRRKPELKVEQETYYNLKLWEARLKKLKEKEGNRAGHIITDFDGWYVFDEDLDSFIKAIEIATSGGADERR